VLPQTFANLVGMKTRLRRFNGKQRMSHCIIYSSRKSGSMLVVGSENLKGRVLDINKQSTTLISLPRSGTTGVWGLAPKNHLSRLGSTQVVNWLFYCAEPLSTSRSWGDKKVHSEDLKTEGLGPMNDILRWLVFREAELRGFGGWALRESQHSC
jgi:hypothetical protein